MNTFDVWVVIFGLGLGSFLLRFSFLGLIGNRPMPDWVLRHLRYTGVAILPALVGPLVVWTDGPGSGLDTQQIIAGSVTVLVGALTRNTFVAIIAGGGALGAMMMVGHYAA